MNTKTVRAGTCTNKTREPKKMHVFPFPSQRGSFRFMRAQLLAVRTSLVLAKLLSEECDKGKKERLAK
jgi:hypothetical protein